MKTLCLMVLCAMLSGCAGRGGWYVVPIAGYYKYPRIERHYDRERDRDHERYHGHGMEHGHGTHEGRR